MADFELPYIDDLVVDIEGNGNYIEHTKSPMGIIPYFNQEVQDKIFGTYIVPQITRANIKIHPSDVEFSSCVDIFVDPISCVYDGGHTSNDYYDDRYMADDLELVLEDNEIGSPIDVNRDYFPSEHVSSPSSVEGFLWMNIYAYYQSPRVLTDDIAEMSSREYGVLSLEYDTGDFIVDDSEYFIHIGTKVNKTIYPRSEFTFLGLNRKK